LNYLFCDKRLKIRMYKPEAICLKMKDVSIKKHTSFSYGVITDKKILLLNRQETGEY
jgi:hypothetical protein